MKSLITDYFLVHADNPDDFNRACKAFVRDGWQPHGGVSVAAAQSAFGDKLSGAQIDYRTIYTQAMIKITEVV